MRTTSALAALAAVLSIAAAGLTTTGCGSGTGTSNPPNSAFFGPGSSPNTTSGTSATLPPPFSAVGIHSDLLSSATLGLPVGNPPTPSPTGGLLNFNLVLIYANDPDVTNPTLLVDQTGTGAYVATGAVPVGQPNWLGFLTTSPPPGGKFKVTAVQGGINVESNEIVVGNFTRNSVNIKQPGGNYSGNPPAITAAPRVSWDPITGRGITPPVNYMIILGSRQPGVLGITNLGMPVTDLKWLATVPATFTSYSWGEAIADHYSILGNNPLDSGPAGSPILYELTVLALDATGWATDSSDSPNANPPPFVQYFFNLEDPPP